MMIEIKQITIMSLFQYSRKEKETIHKVHCVNRNVNYTVYPEMVERTGAFVYLINDHVTYYCFEYKSI